MARFTMIIQRFRTLSINTKLTVIIIFSCLFVSLTASVFFIGLDIISLRRSTIEDLSGLAKVVGINCAAPLEFMDSETADEILSSLSVRPHILQAVLYTADGQSFSRYQASSLSLQSVQALREEFKNERFEPQKESHYFQKTHVDLSVPIEKSGEIIGTIVLQADQDAYHAILSRFVYVVCGITAVTLLLAYFFSTILNKIISWPILALAETTERIRREKNYTLRADDNYDDELGILVKGVNSMLDGIEQRDSQLLVAKMTAEDANKAKSQFLAQMSHEIRTPMNGVLGIASILLKTSLNKKQKQFVQTIYRSGESLLNLINDILDFSKIEAGKLELEPIHFNLREMAEDTVDLFSQHAHEKDITLSCYIDRSVPAYVKGDLERLRQILVNLLSNALKFTGDGEIIFKITLEKTDGENVYLHFEVEDSGIGISPEKQEEIFTAFSQEDRSTTRKFGGTGLGLAICRQLVQMMGGDIGVVSGKGQGSVFWFTTLLTLGNSAEAIACNEHSASVSGKFNASVLVAEDNPTNQIVAQGILELLGCRVDMVDNGKDAASVLEHSNYDLIFMDCQMPVMDGYEATQKIRGMEDKLKSVRTPIIALTAHAMKGDREHCLAIGMDDYLTKPFNETQMLNLLLKWLPAASRNMSAISHVIITPERKMTIQSHVDKIILESFRKMQKAGKPDILNHLVGVYLKSSPKLLQDLRHAVEINDIEKLWQSAHSLKSSSASVGAKYLSSLCQALEIQGREGKIDNSKKSVLEIEVEFKAVANELNSYLSGK